MADDRGGGELVHGTLEMLVLKTLDLEPMHGWESRNASKPCPVKCFSSPRDHSIPRWCE